MGNRSYLFEAWVPDQIDMTQWIDPKTIQQTMDAVRLRAQSRHRGARILWSGQLDMQEIRQLVGLSRPVVCKCLRARSSRQMRVRLLVSTKKCSLSSGLYIHSHAHDRCVVLGLADHLEQTPHDHVRRLDVLCYRLSEPHVRRYVVVIPFKEKRKSVRSPCRQSQERKKKKGGRGKRMSARGPGTRCRRRYSRLTHYPTGRLWRG